MTVGEAYRAGVQHHQAGRLREAESIYRQILAQHPNHSGALHMLGFLAHQVGRNADALELVHKAIAEAPDARRSMEHVRWNQTYARPLVPAHPEHCNDCNPGRRLRIGYVSPDWYSHPVGRFMLPLLTYHDRGQFQVFAYCDVREPDAMTGRLRAQADVWRETSGLSDEQLSQLVRCDGIDILVDLTMHTHGNRLLAFARKPAPAQVTYLAYCSTTGLETMDYRLTDSYFDPPAGTEPVQGVTDEPVYTERSIRLRSYWCYGPPAQTPEVGPLPALTAGQVTFGCLN